VSRVRSVISVTVMLTLLHNIHLGTFSLRGADLDDDEFKEGITGEH